MIKEVQASGTATIPFGLWARRCVVGLYIMSSLSGGLQIAFPDNGGLFLGLTLCVAVLATGWARYDAKSRDLGFLPILQMLYLLAWPVGAVLYLLYRSGIRGLLTAGLHGIALFVLMAGTAAVTVYALHSAGLLDPRFYPAG